MGLKMNESDLTIKLILRFRKLEQKLQFINYEMLPNLSSYEDIFQLKTQNTVLFNSYS